LAANVALFTKVGLPLAFALAIQAEVTLPPQYAVNLPLFFFFICILCPSLNYSIAFIFPPSLKNT